MKNKHKIKAAYKKVDGNLNANSMILFSGNSKNESNYVHCFKHCHCCHFHDRCCCFHRMRSGCLYLGDLNLNEPSIVDDIESKLGSRLSHIGTLQVPHHGSIDNFSSSIVHQGMQCAILSYGTNNKYHHPSGQVIREVIAKGICPHHVHHVTEEQCSMVTQWGRPLPQPAP